MYLSVLTSVPWKLLTSVPWKFLTIKSVPRTFYLNQVLLPQLLKLPAIVISVSSSSFRSLASWLCSHNPFSEDIDIITYCLLQFLRLRKPKIFKFLNFIHTCRSMLLHAIGRKFFYKRILKNGFIKNNLNMEVV